MMTTFMRVYGIGMALIAFNPAMAFAEDRAATGERKILEAISTQYEVTYLGYVEGERMLTLVVDGQTLSFDIDTGEFTIETINDLYTGTATATIGLAGKSATALITMEDEQGNQLSYSAMVEKDSVVGDLVNIAVLDRGDEVQASYVAGSGILAVTAEDGRDPQASGHADGYISNAGTASLTGKSERTHQGRALVATGSRQIKISLLGLLAAVVLLVLVAVAVRCVIETACEIEGIIEDIPEGLREIQVPE